MAVGDQTMPVQGRSQKFVSEGDKTGGLGTEVPQRGPGAVPAGGSHLGAKTPEAKDIYANNLCNNVLTKNSYTVNIKYSIAYSLDTQCLVSYSNVVVMIL